MKREKKPFFEGGTNRSSSEAFEKHRKESETEIPSLHTQRFYNGAVAGEQAVIGSRMATVF